MHVKWINKDILLKVIIKVRTTVKGKKREPYMEINVWKKHEWKQHKEILGIRHKTYKKISQVHGLVEEKTHWGKDS